MLSTYHLTTFGCQMNKSDSERIETVLNGLGLRPVDERGDADLVLVNTCSVRQSAEDRVFGLARQFEALKAARPGMVIAVTGCMPGRDKGGVMRRHLPMVDLYFPIQDLPQLPRWLAERDPERINTPDLTADYLTLRPQYHSTRQAYVTVQTGCNKFCTYCVVPFSRGLEKNRPVADILDEVRHLAARGCVEVTLLGQTVNSYRADPESFAATNPYRAHDAFAALLWEVNQIPEIRRLHFTAPHPLHMTDALLEAMTLPAHLNFLHLPVQSGSSEVLRRMNRRYTRETFLEVIERIKRRLPNIAIGTDIIVGFSGETEAQFEETVSLYQAVEFDIAYTAQYSPRSGTAAFRAFKDDVTKEEKKRRWEKLQAIQEETTLRKNQAYMGKTVSVLVESYAQPEITDELLALPGDIREHLKRVPGTCRGNSREMKVVTFRGPPELVGQVVDVRVTDPRLWVLDGERV